MPIDLGPLGHKVVDCIVSLKAIFRKRKRAFRPPLHRPEVARSFQVLGSDYGGWPVLNGSLTADSRVLSFGVGEDISFDLAVIDRFGCRVEAFDPTPKSRDWLGQQSLPPQFRFHPVGLSDRTQILRFAAPVNPGHVSFSATAKRHDAAAVELPVRALREIVQEIGVAHIDLLKMDIEGSEYATITDIVEHGPLPDQLCVEFHHGMHDCTPQQTLAAVEQLRGAGYRLYYVSEGGREYAFVRVATQ